MYFNSVMDKLNRGIQSRSMNMDFLQMWARIEDVIDEQ